VALDVPSAVRSLALLEPALALGESGSGYRAALAAGRERFHSDPAEDVVDAFLQLRWPGYRVGLEQMLPRAFEQAVADAGAAFDIPALLEWEFTQTKAAEIKQPALSVLAQDSLDLSPRFAEVHQLLIEWLPSTRANVIPDSSHLMMLQQPALTADAIAAFISAIPSA